MSKLGLRALMLAILVLPAACEDAPDHTTLHPKHHHGQKPPSWFKPPQQ